MKETCEVVSSTFSLGEEISTPYKESVFKKLSHRQVFNCNLNSTFQNDMDNFFLRFAIKTGKNFSVYDNDHGQP